ncbi:MAG: tRNA (adenosine(37)-N6)-threonylcarbamoyltransferase complex dimerization subunit type 1 TsaB [Bacteroidales bacterium]|nr:tRNA (adenosine(37)-N6)-threonylcarbamoyltransferase complex dimerization subunit type 1 TsaB [Candidatus Latescibacterota bacterium]
MDERLILALDTSRLKGSVAIARGDHTFCELLFDASDTHSATLMPAIDICVRTAGLDLDEMDLFAVVTGPGSFTGLRIGLATIKALASIRKRPVALVGSLESIAGAFPYCAETVVPVLDARRGEIYIGAYDTSSGYPEELIPPLAVRPGEAAETLAKGGVTERVILCGNGTEAYREVLESVLPVGSRFADPIKGDPSAAVTAMIARRREPVLYEELAGVEPVYIRPPDAKLPADSRLREGGGQG